MSTLNMDSLNNVQSEMFVGIDILKTYKRVLIKNT